MDGGVDADITRSTVRLEELEGILCDLKFNLGSKSNTVVRPVMMYVAKTWAVKKAKHNTLNMAEIRMLRWMCGVAKLDSMRN